MNRAPADSHLDALVVARYVDGRSSVPEAASVETHLESCPRCREEIAEVHRIRRQSQGGSWGDRRWWLRSAAVLLLAAGGGGLVFAALRTGTSPEEVLRSGGTDDAATAVLAAATASSLEDGGLSFQWNGLDDGTVYRVTVTDSAGDLVWTGDTRGSRIDTPPDLPLRPGADYVWVVDALRPDGGAASSGPQSLRLPP